MQKLKKLFHVLTVAIILPGLTGCVIWEGLDSEQRQRVLDAARKATELAVIAGLGKLGESVKELQPYIPNLQLAIEATFAERTDPEEAADDVLVAVWDLIPAEYRYQVINQIAESAEESTPTASPRGEGRTASKVDFGSAFAKALKQ